MLEQVAALKRIAGRMSCVVLSAQAMDGFGGRRACPRWCHVQRTATFLAAALIGGSVVAQTTIYAEQDKLIRVSKDIATLGADLLGDQVSLYNGNVEFRQTDVSIPGNNVLPVSVGRRLAGSTEVRLAGAFDDWDLDIPHLHGVFKNTTGWVTFSGSQARCSDFGTPDTGYFQGGIWDPNEYWHGSFIYLPGQGSQEILIRSASNPNYPDDGNAWPLTTQSLVSIGCLSTLSLGAGEGFIAVTPDGTRYRFDWMVSRSFPYVSKPTPSSQELASGGLARAANAGSRATGNPPPTDVNAAYTLARKEVWILPTLVTDRHGNTVTYTYDPAKPWRLNSITASDGRSITLAYDGTSNRVASVSDGTRSWSYTYSNGLSRVTQPDGAQWQFAMSSFTQAPAMYTGSPSCDNEGYLGGGVSGSMTHPSGAVGTFVVAPTSHGRSFVDRECRGDPSYGDHAVYPRYIASRSLQTKTITGPGLNSMTWAYTYSASSAAASWYDECNGSCLDYKTVDVVDPRNVLTRYTFGNRYRVTEGQLQKVEVGPVGGPVLRTTALHYRDPAAGPYPSFPGVSPQRRGNGELASRHAPQDQRVITQQGKTFNWQASTFDTKARPTVAIRASDAATGYSRTEATTYADNTSLWVLGQVQSVSTAGTTPVFNTFDPNTAQLLSSSAFGLLRATYSWYADGTLHTHADGAGHTTTYADWYRGIPRSTTHPDGTTQNATVDARGWITALTDENGITTGYSHDAMGRLASINPPAPFNATTLVFEQAGAEYDLAAGHWRQTVATGNGVKVSYFDALWRPVLTRTYDAADEANTRSMVLRVFDSAGRTRFESYPQRSISGVNAQPYGQATSYDALGRRLQTLQDSEQGWLTTNHAYQANFQTAVTNPRGYTTTTTDGAFDDPDAAFATAIAAPEGVSVSISRDVWGKPTAITRGGAWGGSGPASVTRSYVYDGYQRLCKTIEPESGATVQAYDAASNVAWRASGLNLSSTSSCDQGSVAGNRMISHGYDARNRLTGTSYGDGSPGITRSYTPDGLLSQITASKPGTNTITWTYSYDGLRRLTNERYQWGDPNNWWDFSWSIDANGHVNGLGDPWGYMDHAPNALGQPTQISGYVSNVIYHPNGAVSDYQRSNGTTHYLGLNARGLPEWWYDAGVTNDVHTYDANGNVNSITDHQQGGVTNRSMGYDGLDRLKQANGMWGTGSFDYDALDNMRRSTVGGSDLHYTYDGANRLANLTGTQTTGYGYDANGNVTQRGGQTFSFDIGNRMSNAPGVVNSYLYDGHGRRNLAFMPNDYMHQAYTQDGKLRFAWRLSQGGRRHVYLGSTLIAETDQAQVTTFMHSDALGSPVASTNSSGGVISRTHYEPYGKTWAGTDPARIGFTGHVNDTDTGLVYMQQRYYEPIAGRFLSVDPVVTDWDSGSSFNRYVYAQNNPYRYTDPDGRNPAAVARVGLTSYRVATNLGAGRLGSWIGIRVYDVLHQEGNSADDASDAAVKGLTAGLEGQKGIYVDPNGNAADALDSLPGEVGENGQKTLPDGSFAGVHVSTTPGPTQGMRTVHIHRPAGKGDRKIRYPNDKQKEKEKPKEEKPKEEKPKEDPK